MSSVFKAKRRGAIIGTQNVNQVGNQTANLSQNVNQSGNFSQNNDNNMVDLIDEGKDVISSGFTSGCSDVDSIDLGRLSIDDKNAFEYATMLEQKAKQRKETTKAINAKVKETNENLTERIKKLQQKVGRTNLHVRVTAPNGAKQIWKLETKKGALNKVDEKYLVEALNEFFIVKKYTLQNRPQVEQFVKILFSEENRKRAKDGEAKAVLVLDNNFLDADVVDLE